MRFDTDADADSRGKDRMFTHQFGTATFVRATRSPLSNALGEDDRG